MRFLFASVAAAIVAFLLPLEVGRAADAPPVPSPFRDDRIFAESIAAAEALGIPPRRLSGLSAKQQRSLAVAIRRARMLALLPFAVSGE